jgi:hypothetical protein
MYCVGLSLEEAKPRRLRIEAEPIEDPIEIVQRLKQLKPELLDLAAKESLRASNKMDLDTIESRASRSGGGRRWRVGWWMTSCGR